MHLRTATVLHLIARETQARLPGMTRRQIASPGSQSCGAYEGARVQEESFCQKAPELQFCEQQATSMQGGVTRDHEDD